MQNKTIILIGLQSCLVLNSVPQPRIFWEGSISSWAAKLPQPIFLPRSEKIADPTGFSWYQIYPSSWSWKATVNWNSSWHSCILLYSGRFNWSNLIGCFELISWECQWRGSCDEARTTKISQFSAGASQIIICEKARAIVVASPATWSCTLCWPRDSQQHADTGIPQILCPSVLPAESSDLSTCS